MLLVPRLLWIVVKQLSSFIICNSLLIRTSSNIFPLLSVCMSCPPVDLHLLSIANVTPGPFACAIFVSIFDMSVFISRLISKYLLFVIILVLSTSASNTTTSSLDRSFILLCVLGCCLQLQPPDFFLLLM